MAEEVKATFESIKARLENQVDEIVQSSLKNYEAYPGGAEATRVANTISEKCIARCTELQPEFFKFQCTCIILEKGECGFSMSASCFWNHQTDGNFNKKYDFDKFTAIVNLLGVLI